MKKQHLVWLIFGILLLGGILIWKRGGEAEAVRVGAILPMTGELGFAGEVERRALEIFDEQSPHVTIVYADSKGSPKEAISAARQLLDSGVRHFIVSLSYINEAVSPVIAADRGTTIALSMDERPDLAAQRNFRLYVSFQEELDMLSNAAEVAKSGHVAVLYANVSTMKSAVERHLAKRLAEKGITLTSESFEMGQHDFKPLLAKVSAVQPDLVRILDYGDRLPKILQQIEETQSLQNATIISGIETLFCKPSDVPETIRTRFFFTAPPSLLQGRELLPEYRRKHGVPAHFDGVFAFDAATFMEQYLIPDTGKNATTEDFWTKLSPFQGQIGTYQASLPRGLVPVVSWATIDASGKIVPISAVPIIKPSRNQ